MKKSSFLKQPVIFSTSPFISYKFTNIYGFGQMIEFGQFSLREDPSKCLFSEFHRGSCFWSSVLSTGWNSLISILGNFSFDQICYIQMITVCGSKIRVSPKSDRSSVKYFGTRISEADYKCLLTDVPTSYYILHLKPVINISKLHCSYLPWLSNTILCHTRPNFVIGMFLDCKFLGTGTVYVSCCTNTRDCVCIAFHTKAP